MALLPGSTGQHDVPAENAPCASHAHGLAWIRNQLAAGGYLP
jgi:hypothetical protein